MKQLIRLTLLLLVFSSCATKKSISNTSNSVYIEINKNKTSRSGYGDILLHFKIVNNSNNDITILKPNNTFEGRFEFFSNTMQCDDIPITEMGFDIEHRAVTADDYLVIKSKQNVDLMMNGRFYDWLSCNSDSVKIKVKYNPFKKINADSKYYNEIKDIMQTASSIDIYSQETVINLNK